jgi:DNA uptake protein ComE-like DNA-binding protein
MDPKINHLKKWFGYNRRERRAATILILIVALVFISRYLIPGKEAEIKNLTSEIIDYKPALLQKQNKLLDLNTSDSIMLDLLPGIGPVLSARIIKYRNLIGGYANIYQLNEVYGLSPETFALISEMVYADSLVVKLIKINLASYKELIRHPYFKTSEVASIIKYRELNEHIANINELIENKIISAEKAKKISPYLSFE